MKASFVSPSVTMTFAMALSSATSLSGLNCSAYLAWRASSVSRGSMTISVAPRSTAFFIQVAATGWFTVGLAADDHDHVGVRRRLTGFDTAPEPRPSSSAATEEAWHSRVQWSTLFVPKPVRTSFWKR
jgi:hypothetical protein